jgi:hypothetical protein
VSFWEENGGFEGIFISSVSKRSCAGRIFRGFLGWLRVGVSEGQAGGKVAYFF